MSWDSWRDDYDSWKTRSPDDERDEECRHEDFELDSALYAHCNRCGETWPATIEDIITWRTEKNAMQMSPVKSGDIHEVGHDPASENKMRIRFKNGGVYEATGVPAEHHAGLLAADSPGGYFHQHLKGKYKFKKVEE